MGKWPNKRSRRNSTHTHQSSGKRKCSLNRRDFPSRQDGPSREPRVYSTFVSLSEDQVEITEYVRKSPGFVGTIKSRFSDFHVNEIDTAGNEVKLTNMEVPKAKDDSLDDEELKKGKKELEAIITEEIWSQISSLTGTNSQDKVETVDIDVTNLGKDKRTLIHKTLKAACGSALVSTTITVEENKFIRCFKAKNHKEIKRSRWFWPGEYVYFVGHKENTDTVRAASDLAKYLRLRPSMVNYAGTKDKRAKTSQLFCVKKRDPEDIAYAAKRLPYLKVGNFSFKEQVLKLGDLNGNRFRIAIRQVDGDPSEIQEALKSIKINGFINYYGLQRFGNCAGIPTFDVGIALLKSEYKEACELILKPRDGEQPFMKNIREFWWKTRDSVKAAGMLYDSKFIEKKLLDGLAEFGENDYANALRKIPRNMLLLYTHSYQSLVWNRVASRRIKEFGLTLIAGDLVFKDKTCKFGRDPFELLDLDADIATDEVDEVCEKAVNENAEPAESQYKAMVHALTKEDIATNAYSIFDVVLPLPGYDITYPANELAEWYESILGEKGLSSEKLKHNVKTYSLAGAYRKLIAKPENISWEYKGYTDPTCNLIASDWETLNGIGVDANISDAKFQALVLDFILPPSSYATMALRELLKVDTSVASQQKLTFELNESSRQETQTEMEITACEVSDPDGSQILEAKESQRIHGSQPRQSDELFEVNETANTDEGQRKRASENVEHEEVKKLKPQ